MTPGTALISSITACAGISTVIAGAVASTPLGSSNKPDKVSIWKTHGDTAIATNSTTTSLKKLLTLLVVFSASVAFDITSASLTTALEPTRALRVKRAHQPVQPT